ncbi:MAG: hypothetical protein ACLUNZ_00255 [Evtepia sp.]
MKLQRGAITPASIAGVVKGVDGRPGELRGVLFLRQRPGDPVRQHDLRRLRPPDQRRRPGRDPRPRGPAPARSTPARPPSVPTSPAPRWRSIPWRSSRS